VILNCPNCKKQYKLDDKHLEGKSRIRVRCPNCRAMIDAAAGGQEPSTQRIRAGTLAGADAGGGQAALTMPPGMKLSIAVLQGPDSGALFPIEKSSITIGRAQADIVLNDPEVSRTHARIEVKEKEVLLKDLKSTNGTYVNEQRVLELPIEDKTEFRMGSTTLMLIVTQESP
jgi:predicted Zn finger-like uncharacterized protein